MGSLPILRDADGTVIGQSLAILEYIEDRVPEPDMRGNTPAEGLGSAQSLLGPISRYLADRPHLQSLRRHLVPSLSPSTEGTSHRQKTQATSLHRGRHHLGTSGRLFVGIGGGLPRNLQH
ncbi:hypothetical protein [Ciceribacter sichuanensis]|uniref:hypothetical protein n=1 Tax=Ciceribacter sichuanensis TaxID=2949647 RepID=UPI003CC91D2A